MAKEKDKYPRWASVAPNGEFGVFAKGSNLWVMDSTSLRKAAKDEKDSTIVEHRLTTDGIRQFGYGYGNYSGRLHQEALSGRACLVSGLETFCHDEVGHKETR